MEDKTPYTGIKHFRWYSPQVDFEDVSDQIKFLESKLCLIKQVKDWCSKRYPISPEDFGFKSDQFQNLAEMEIWNYMHQYDRRYVRKVVRTKIHFYVIVIEQLQSAIEYQLEKGTGNEN